jgi:hypothetical protein
MLGLALLLVRISRLVTARHYALLLVQLPEATCASFGLNRTDKNEFRNIVILSAAVAQACRDAVDGQVDTLHHLLVHIARAVTLQKFNL